MTDIIKNKAEIFKQICFYDLNEVNITSELIYLGSGRERRFEFVLRNNNNEIICIGEMPPVKNIENYIKSIEDKIKKGFLNYNVFIYSIQYDKIMYVTPYREWPTYDFERMGMTQKDFINELKKSCIEFKQKEDLEFDKLNEEVKNLKQNKYENEKKYEKLKYDSELYKKIYDGDIDELKNQSALIKKNEIARLKYELKKIENKVDLFTPLRKINLAEKCEYCFSFQMDKIILKVDKWWYFEGGKDEVACYSYSGCNYFLFDLAKMDYEEVKDNSYSDIINWLRFDWDYKLIN